jgi:iron complex outermembrane recepter protein
MNSIFNCCLCSNKKYIPKGAGEVIFSLITKKNKKILNPYGGFNSLLRHTSCKTIVKAKKSNQLCWLIRENRGIKVWMQQCLALLLLILTLNAAATVDRARVYNVNLPAQNVVDALTRLSEQTDVLVLFSYDIASTRQANSVAGVFTLQQIMNLLLKGTGLSGGLSEKGVLTISLGESEVTNHHERDLMNTKRKKLPNAILAALTSIFTYQGMAAENGVPNMLLEEVVVTGSKLSNRRAIAIKQNADQIVDAVSADDIGNLPDINIADSARRIVGVSTSYRGDEAQNVVIRGLRSTLNHVTIDGMTIASDSGGDRAINMKALPSGATNGIEVYKSVTANLDGHGIGGNLNLKSRSAYDNEGMHFTSTFGLTHWTQDIMPDGDDKLSGQLEVAFSNTFGVNDQFGVVVAGTINRKDRDELEYNTGVNFDAANDTPEVRNFNPKLRDTTWDRKGGSIKFEYQPNEQWYSYLSYFDYAQEEDEYTQNFNLERRSSVENLSAAGGEYATGRASSQVYQDDIVRASRGAHLHLMHWLDDNESLSFDVASAEAWKYQDREQYKWRTEDATELGYSYANNIGSLPSLIALNDPNYITDGSNYGLQELYIDEYKAKERVNEVKADYRYNFDSGFDGWGYAGGLLYRESDRFEDKNKRYAQSDDLLLSDFMADDPYFYAGVPSFNVPNMMVDGEALFAYYRNNPGEFDFDSDKAANRSARDDSSSLEKISAAYVMARHSSERLTVSGGLRYERTVFSSDAFSRDKDNGDALTPVSNSSRYNDWMPSFNVTYALTEELRLRGAYSYTVGRPNPGDMRAKEDISVDGNVTRISRGNPNLKPQYSSNIDISLEYYFPGGDGMLAAGLFHKSVDDWIVSTTQENVLDAVTGEMEIIKTKINSESAVISGLELGYVQNSLDFLPGVLANFGLSANFTYIKGELEFTNPDGDKIASDHIADQPEYIGNLALFYTFDKGEVRLAYNYTGENSGAPDSNGDQYKERWKDNLEKIDMVAKYFVNDNFTVRVQASNLTDTGISDQDYTGPDRAYRKKFADHGMSYSMAVTYNY